MYEKLIERLQLFFERAYVSGDKFIILQEKVKRLEKEVYRLEMMIRRNIDI